MSSNLPKNPKKVQPKPKANQSANKDSRLEEIFKKRVGKDFLPLSGPKTLKSSKPKPQVEKKTSRKTQKQAFGKSAKSSLKASEKSKAAKPKVGKSRSQKASVKKQNIVANRVVEQDAELLNFEKPLWLLPGEWWNSPEAIDNPQEAKQLFPAIEFGNIEETKEFALFDHRSLEKHLRPPLERDNFEDFFEQEAEEEERGEEVSEKFLAAKRVDISTRRIPPRTFNSAAEYLLYLWGDDKPIPKKPIGGMHISRLTKYDFPIRVTAFPRPLFLDYGYPLQFSLFSNLIQLEVQDYVLEVEDLFRRQDAESTFTPVNVLQRHQFEVSIRQKAAEAVTHESGEGEIMLRHFPLLPLISNQEAHKHFRHLFTNIKPWRVFASEDIVPFKYSNAFVRGEPRPSFSHISQREEKRYSQLCRFDSLTYEPFCEKSEQDEAPLNKRVEKLFRDTIREDFEKVYLFSQQLNNQKKYKLTFDELIYFGFSDQKSSSLPHLQTFNLPKTPLVFEQWKFFVEEEAPVEIDFESENSGAFNKR